MPRLARGRDIAPGSREASGIGTADFYARASFPFPGQRSRRSTEWCRTFDPLALAGAVHRLPQIAAPLHVQPEVRTVAEHAREYESGRRRYGPAVVAQLVDVLALNTHRLGQCGLGQPHGLHKLLDQDFAD